MWKLSKEQISESEISASLSFYCEVFLVQLRIHAVVVTTFTLFA